MIIVVSGIFAWRAVSKDLEIQMEQSARQNVLRAAIQCCAIEGAYPPNVEYLEENYGLLLDHDRYIISYELFASNILPEVEIIRK